MNNRLLVFSISLLFYSNTITAQFYTVSKKKNIINVEVIQKENDREKELNASTDGTKSIEKPILSESIENKPPKKVEADSIDTKFLLSLPLNKIRITSNYGVRQDPISGKKKKHHGIDLAASSDNVRAIMPGKIIKIGYEKKGLGNYVKIEHGDFESIYGHLHTSIGTEGDLVNAGTVIGLSGSTGKSTGEHLHLAIKFKSNYIDPKPILDYITDIKKAKSGKE